jgi:hypothetical protein
MRPRWAAQPRRVSRANQALLDEVIAATDRPVREAYVSTADELLYGLYDRHEDLVTINLVLLRVSVFMHEQIHRVRPEFSEATVRRRTTQLVRAMSDEEIQDLNRRIVAAIRAQRRRPRVLKRAA